MAAERFNVSKLVKDVLGDTFLKWVFNEKTICGIKL